MLRICLLVALTFSIAAISRAESTDAATLVRQGQELAAKGDHAAAIALYDKALERDPHLADAHAWKATSLLDLNDSQSAETEINKALKLTNREPGIHVIAGRIAVARGQIEQARQAYDQAAKLAPKKAGLFYGDLAAVLAAKNDEKLNAAIELALKAAATADPPNLDALFNLGQSYVSAGKQEGRTYLQQYLDASGKLPEQQRNLRKMQLAKQMIRALDVVRSEQQGGSGRH